MSELNSSPDIPLELGFVKLSSMNLISLDSDLQDSTTSSSHQSSRRRRKISSSPGQHRVLLIEGLGTL